MTSGVEPSASYWLDSPVSTINFTSTGTPSPSAFVVTMKQNIGGNVSDTNRFYLVARKYNGSWLAHVGATLNSQISVPATAGYTQFAVRAYKSASDANAWNNNFVAEKGVGVAKDGAIGATGATGAFPRDRGVWASGQTYVWNADYRDKVIYLIGGVYYNFLVKNYGASVTAAPTSANGDSNWEAMQKFVNIATDTLFADGANVAGFMYKNGMMKSQNENMEISGKKNDAYIKLGGGKALLKEDGSGKLADGGISWDSDSNVKVSGIITADLLYSPGSDMDSLADSEGNMTVNPSTQGSTFFSADGLGGTITLPPASSWNGLRLEFVVDMTSRAAKNPDKYKATNYFCGLVGAYNNKTEIQMARPYVLEMKAFNNHWYITRMDLIE